MKVDNCKLQKFLSSARSTLPAQDSEHFEVSNSKSVRSPQLKWLTRRPVLKGHLLQCPPLVVAWERPASSANQREHLDVLESTKVSAVSPDVF